MSNNTKTLKRADWSANKRGKAIALCEEDYTYEEIAGRLGENAAKSGVRKLCERFENSGSTNTSKRTGENPN